MLRATLAALATLGTFAAATAAHAQDTRRSVEAAERQGPIVIDGRGDEPTWSRAEETSGFVERIPTPRATPPVDTRFRVLYDEEAIYVLVEMDLLPGETPRGLELRRDNFRIYSDDAVTLKFDIARDRRTTVGFAVNAAGTQVDYVAVDNGRTFRREYDAVWESATSVTETAWIAEFRVPIVALGLPDADVGRVMGFNVTRDHNARFATDDWAHLPPELGPVSALNYGDLTGVDVGGGAPITFIPYVLGSFRSPLDPMEPEDGIVVDTEDGRFTFRGGGDVKVRLGRDVWGEVTLLTDFAEVDLDDQVVNLDRFPIFFEERRPFFINGLDIFLFGAEGTSQLFYSRRIGLDENRNVVPMWGGAKVYGHAGPIGFGILDVATGSPNSNWGVARLRGNIGEAGYLGAMVTARTSFEDASDAGYAAGIDGTLRFLEGERLQLTGSFAGTDSALIPDDNPWNHASGTAALSWLGHNFRPTASFLYIGDDYDPDIGFVRRTGIARTRGEIAYVVFPEKLNLRDIRFTTFGTFDQSDEFDQSLGANAGVAMDVNWPSWGFDVTGSVVEDVLQNDFDLIGRFPIEMGTYSGVSVEYGLYAASTLNPNASLRYSASSAFFGGTVQRIVLDGGVSLGPHLRLAANVNQAFIRLPGIDLQSTFALNAVVTIAPSTTLFADIIFQVNDVIETTAGLLRVRWRYFPGSDLFLVYRQQVGFDGQLGTEVTLKLNWRYDALL